MLIGKFVGSLVLISVLVAILASYTALSMAGRVASVSGQAERSWIAGGAFAMSIGIWAMHFIGMLAFRLPIPLGYDPWLTAVSWMLALGASWLALWLVGKPQLPVGRLVAGAIAMGAGINAMHYTGMAAMRIEPGIVYDLTLFFCSVAIAILASGIALWMAFKLRHTVPNAHWAQFGSAVVMGLAIVGMHYTGMAAANFAPGSVCMAASGMNNDWIALVTIVGTVSVLAFALLTSEYDARLASRGHTLVVSQALAEERQMLLERERRARIQAEQASAIKDEFLATLSHELRTPLNAILGWGQVLQLKTGDPAALKKGLASIERSARAQTQLIDDLLDMSRILSGKVHLELRLVDLRTVIDAAISVVSPTATVRDIVLEKHFAQGVGPVRADPDRMQQLLWNLLANAIKFSPNGGRVDVALGQANGMAVITVADAGIGIIQEFLPYVFDRFRQADSSTTRRHGGLGLGLSIVRHLAEVHGGVVEVDSRGQGQGSTFTVRLPLVGRTRASDLPDTSDTLYGVGIPRLQLIDLKGTRVLIVDDDSGTRELCLTILSECGATVGTADSTDEAMATIRAQRWDVLVTDIGMPDADGYELLRRLRTLEQERTLDGTPMRSLPAVAVSAFTRDSDLERARQAGFVGYLTKPVDPAKLMAAVRDAAAQQG